MVFDTQSSRKERVKPPKPHQLLPKFINAPSNLKKWKTAGARKKLKGTKKGEGYELYQGEGDMAYYLRGFDTISDPLFFENIRLRCCLFAFILFFNIYFASHFRSFYFYRFYYKSKTLLQIQNATAKTKWKKNMDVGCLFARQLKWVYAQNLTI